MGVSHAYGSDPFRLCEAYIMTDPQPLDLEPLKAKVARLKTEKEFRDGFNCYVWSEQLSALIVEVETLRAELATSGTEAEAFSTFIDRLDGQVVAALRAIGLPPARHEGIADHLDTLVDALIRIEKEAGKDRPNP
jgi:hypothetical protein